MVGKLKIETHKGIKEHLVNSKVKFLKHMS